MRYAIAVCAAATLLAVSGCGQSEQDQAKSDFCDARADLQAHVDNLSKLSLSTATADGIKSDLNAIKGDLQKMRDAQGKLDQDRKQQAQAAWQKFQSQVSAVASTVGSSTSLSAAGAQLQAALQQLGTSFRQTLARVDCG